MNKSWKEILDKILDGISAKYRKNPPIPAGQPAATAERIDSDGGGGEPKDHEGSYSKPTHPLTAHGPAVTDQLMLEWLAELMKDQVAGSYTKFIDRAQMELTILHCLNSNEVKINSWLETPPKTGAIIGLDFSPNLGNLGRGFQIAEVGGAINLIDAPLDKVRVQLIFDGKGAYFIQSANVFNDSIGKNKEVKKSDWKDVFDNIFTGYVGQETFLDAAEMMAFFSTQEYQDHLDFENAFDEALKACDEGDQDVITLIRGSTGYSANSFSEASSLIIRLRGLYLYSYVKECGPFFGENFNSPAV